MSSTDERSHTESKQNCQIRIESKMVLSRTLKLQSFDEGFIMKLRSKVKLEFSVKKILDQNIVFKITFESETSDEHLVSLKFT